MFESYTNTNLFKKIADDPKTFPKEAIDVLKNSQLLKIKRNSKSNTIWDFAQFIDCFELLFKIGGSDLSVGRIVEGHINALLLIFKYGNAEQINKYFTLAESGNLFGVWNTERPFEKLKVNIENEEVILNGSKSFCSGALHIDFPIITAHTTGGLQMLILDTKRTSGLVEDWSLWNPIGMKASTSCRFELNGIKMCKTDLLGNANDYYLNPIFSWGAVRFSTVQLGGAQKIVDSMLFHLKKTNRVDDPYQKMRLGEVTILMTTAKLWIDQARMLQKKQQNFSEDYLVNFANMMRTITCGICEKIISLAEKSVGIQGVLIGNPLEKPIRDLRVYLKQAGPDEALANVGHFAASNEQEDED